MLKTIFFNTCIFLLILLIFVVNVRSGDDVCSLPIDGGTCLALIPRVAYNTTSKKCEPFTYGGCNGNANNFENLTECQNTCVCSLPPDVGQCRAAIPRYFFNKTSRKCEQFTYGGCGGNANNFEILADCQDACDVCSLPIDAGPCKAAIPRYAYNSCTGKCEQFTYGGCEGNANNFGCLEECQNACQCGN